METTIYNFANMNHKNISFFVPSELTLENIFAVIVITGMVIVMTILVMKYLDLKNNFNDRVETIRQYYDNLYNKEKRKLMRIPTQIAELKSIVKEIERCYKQEVKMSFEDTLDSTLEEQSENSQDNS